MLACKIKSLIRNTKFPKKEDEKQRQKKIEKGKQRNTHTASNLCEMRSGIAS